MRACAAIATCVVLLAAALVASPAAAFKAKVRHAEVRGGQIAWYERGSGPPLVMLIGTRVPGARLRLFAGAHGFLFQQRIAFAKVIDHFLAG